MSSLRPVPGRWKRVAVRELRFGRGALPATRFLPGVVPIRVTGFHIAETDLPDDEPPVQWHLLTPWFFRLLPKAGVVIFHFIWRLRETEVTRRRELS
ncbi:MAG: hypothetical protein OXD29_08920, partial [Roseovarius sp.]|nr:hypothetical protein [Roseovarius sp.]